MMSQKRPWTEEEDRLLKYVFQTSKLTKWSHIAHKLQEDHGVKGKNGKQCRERYTTHIDATQAKDEWSYNDQQKLFELHNELGNKWAIIGSKLGRRSDNCVKNHFYSLLRKALRKLNRVIQQGYRKQMKQIKPNVLYRIVEVSQDKFKLFPSYQHNFSHFANQLKKQMLEFSYDQEQEQQGNSNGEQAKGLIDKINEFGNNYKKKAKKQRRGSGQGQDLLTPNRYQPKKCNSEHEESEGTNSIHHSSETSNVEDISDDQIHRSIRRIRKNSADSEDNLPLRIRTRAQSQGNCGPARTHSLVEAGTNTMNEQQRYEQERNEQMREQSLGIEGILQGLKLLQQQQNVPPHPMLMKRETSKYSRYSQQVEGEQYHFFEDSQIQMRILPEMQFGQRKQSQDESMFN